MGRNVEYTINNQRDSKLHMFHDVHKWVFSSLLNLLKNSSNTTLLRSRPFPVIRVGKVTVCGRRHWRSFPLPISEPCINKVIIHSFVHSFRVHSSFVLSCVLLFNCVAVRIFYFAVTRHFRYDLPKNFKCEQDHKKCTDIAVRFVHDHRRLPVLHMTSAAFHTKLGLVHQIFRWLAHLW